MHTALTWVLHVAHSLGLWGALAVSVTLAVLSVVVAALVVVSWGPHHFKGEPPEFWANRHPVARVAGIVMKNVAGVLVVLMGIVLALPGVPGQGFLLILIGLSLVNFPGKRRVEIRLVRQPRILRALNRLRARLGHPPLEVD